MISWSGSAQHEELRHWEGWGALMWTDEGGLSSVLILCLLSRVFGGDTWKAWMCAPEMGDTVSWCLASHLRKGQGEVAVNGAYGEVLIDLNSETDGSRRSMCIFYELNGVFTHMHMHTHTHTHTEIHIYIQTHTQTHTLTHTCTDTHTNTHTHTLTHTHTHWHTPTYTHMGRFNRDIKWPKRAWMGAHLSCYTGQRIQGKGTCCIDVWRLRKMPVKMSTQLFRAALGYRKIETQACTVDVSTKMVVFYSTSPFYLLCSPGWPWTSYPPYYKIWPHCLVWWCF